MSSNYKLEVCAFNIQSAIIAQNVGAARVELCDNPVEGGTTPSYGCIARTREKISIDLYPIIRPRAGYYLYDEDEFDIMRRDILFCKEVNCDGISIVVQKKNGEIDVDRLKRIVEWAYPMGVTCNRVFDAAPDPYKALEDVISSGCERILTSGLKTGAPEGADLLGKLVQLADDRIIIMPGAGIRSSNIRTLIKHTGATEYHTSARRQVKQNVDYSNPEIADIGNIFISSEEELRAILSEMRES